MCSVFGVENVCQKALRTVFLAGSNILQAGRDSVRAMFGVGKKGGEDKPEDEEDKPEDEFHPKAQTAIQKAFQKAMEVLIEHHGERMPHIFKTLGLNKEDEAAVYISPGVHRDKAEVFESFRKAGSIPSNVSDRYLYTLWDRWFSYVEIKRHIPFSQCQLCSDFHTRLTSATSPEERAKVNKEREWHRVECKLWREKLHCRMSLADTYPEDVMFLTVDGMDQKKTQLPHQSRPSKDVENKGEPLQSKLTACLIRNGVSGFYGAWTLPTHEMGSDYICSVINRTLCMYEENMLKVHADFNLPPMLILQLDNCGKENKNQYLIKYLGLLIYMGVFARIEVHFLPVGHTHTQVDQAISVVARAIRTQDIATLEELMNITDGLFKGMTFVRNEEVLDIFDIKEMTNNICHKFQGLGTARDQRTNEKVSLHALRIERTADDQILLFYKDRDDSEPWMGKWSDVDKGLEIFLTKVFAVPPIVPGTFTFSHTLYNVPVCPLRYPLSLLYMPPAHLLPIHPS